MSLGYALLCMILYSISIDLLFVDHVRLHWTILVMLHSMEDVEEEC
jgi:hypothetical protein